MAAFTIEGLIRQRQLALTAAIDASAVLKGAALVIVVDGKTTLVRPSRHISGRNTAFVVNVDTKPGIMGMVKALHDRLIKLPDAPSSFDVASRMVDQLVTQPINRFVDRPDFYESIVPKIIGLGFAGIGLIVAFPAIGAAASAGSLVMLLTASAGMGFAVAGVGVGIQALATQITDPTWTAMLEKSNAWFAFQASLEVGGWVTGMAAAKPLKDQLVKALSDATFQKTAIVRAKSVGDIAARVRAMPDKDFIALCQLLRQRSRRPGAAVSGLRSMRSAGMPSALAVRSVRSSFAEHAAKEITQEAVNRVRKDFYTALFTKETLRMLVSKDTASAAGRAIPEFARDRATMAGTIASALPSSITGSSSGLFSAAADKIGEVMGGVSVYIAQDQDDLALALP